LQTVLADIIMVSETQTDADFDDEFAAFDVITIPAKGIGPGQGSLLAVRRSPAYNTQLQHKDETSLWVRITDAAGMPAGVVSGGGIHAASRISTAAVKYDAGEV